MHIVVLDVERRGEVGTMFWFLVLFQRIHYGNSLDLMGVGRLDEWHRRSL